jgi:hypothetical protein
MCMCMCMCMDEPDWCGHPQSRLDVIPQVGVYLLTLDVSAVRWSMIPLFSGIQTIPRDLHQSDILENVHHDGTNALYALPAPCGWGSLGLAFTCALGIH